MTILFACRTSHLKGTVPIPPPFQYQDLGAAQGSLPWQQWGLRVMGKARGKLSEGGPELAWRRVGREKMQQQTTFTCSLKLGLCSLSQFSPLVLIILSINFFPLSLPHIPFVFYFDSPPPLPPCDPVQVPFPLLHVKVRIHPRLSPAPKED